MKWPIVIYVLRCVVMHRISNYSFVTCSSCTSNTHILCLHDAKSITNKFPNGNVVPKYVCDILCSPSFLFRCNACINALPLSSQFYIHSTNNNVPICNTLVTELETNRTQITKIDVQLNATNLKSATLHRLYTYYGILQRKSQINIC